MMNRGKIARALVCAALTASATASACTDDGAVLASTQVAIPAKARIAVLVERQNQQVWLEVGKVRYSLPNDRLGVEMVHFNGTTATTADICVHGMYRHNAGAGPITFRILDASSGLSQEEWATVKQVSDAARQWALATPVAQKSAAALLEQAASRTGADTLGLRGMVQLAAVRAALHLVDYDRVLALIDRFHIADSADDALAAAAGLARGQADSRRNRSAQALASFRAALTHHPNPQLEAELRNLIGEVLLNLGQIAEGKANIETAARLAGDDHALLARIHNNLGYVWLKQAYAGNLAANEVEQQLLASIDEHLVARAFAISAQEKEELGSIENNLGTLYDRVGELRNASRHFRESLKLADATQDPLSVRVIYQNLGNLSLRLGDYLKARSYLEAARKLGAETSSALAQRAQCLLGRDYQLMKDYVRAIDTHQQCRQWAAQSGSMTQELDALADLAEDHAEQARQQELQSAMNDAQQSLQQAWQTIDEAKTLWAAGAASELLRPATGNGAPKPVPANLCELSPLTANLKMTSESGAARSESDFRLAIKLLSRHALLAAKVGKQKEAMQSLAQVAELTQSASYPELIEFLNAAMHVYKAGDDRDRTLRCGERALALVDALHEGLAAERNGAAWSARTHDIYVLQADMLLDAAVGASQTDASAQAVSALAIVERSRAINLRQQLAMPKLVEAGSPEQQKLHANLERIAASSAARQQIDEVLPTDYYHQYDLLELARLDNVKSVPVPAPLSLKEIQQQLGKQQQVLYYFIAEDDCYLFDFTATSFRFRRLGTTAQLEALLAPVSAADKTASAFPLAPLRQLARFLLPEELATSTAAELLIVPHRGLDTLPFAALQLPGTDAYQPLIGKFAIKEVPSLSAYFMKKNRRAPQNRKDIAVFADPVFAGSKLKADADAETADFHGWTAKLQPLPYTGTEAKNLAAGFGSGQVLEYIGPKATLANLVSSDVRAARILHIATHGYFHSTGSDNVGLVLSAVDVKGKEVANFVTLSELLGHAFDNELVVISGCDTAMGLELNGEGMFGLTRGFLAQGAGQVVSTLWPVSDRGSAEFMKLFYRHLHESRDASLALQQAQKDLSGNPAFRSPYYWAGYVLTSVTPVSTIGFK